MRIWFKRNKNSKDIPATTTLKDVDDPVILHDHDLTKWNYLGYTRCTYINEEGKTTGEYPIFLFVSKNNEKRRSYHIAGDDGGSVERSHPYIQKSIKPWSVGEGEIYHRINGEGNYPSDYLKEYILDKFDAEWDEESNWWGTSDKAKYNSANKKQKREQKAKAETVPETNIVTVDFGKQT
jgi:hypothetical protein